MQNEFGGAGLVRAFCALLAIVLLAFGPGAAAAPAGDAMPAAGCCGDIDAPHCDVHAVSCAVLCQGALPHAAGSAPGYSDPAQPVAVAVSTAPRLAIGTRVVVVARASPADPPAYLLFRRLLL